KAQHWVSKALADLRPARSMSIGGRRQAKLLPRRDTAGIAAQIRVEVENFDITPAIAKKLGSNRPQRLARPDGVDGLAGRDRFHLRFRFGLIRAIRQRHD